MPRFTRVLALLGAFGAAASTTGCVADGYGGGYYDGGYYGGYSSYPSNVYVAPQPVYVQRTIYVSPYGDQRYWHHRRRHRHHHDRD